MRLRPRLICGLALAIALHASCKADPPPPQRELLHLRGNPYQRGLQHGTQLKSKIRSFYTTLLTASLLPYLNREQPGIAAFLPEYQQPQYLGGQFSYQLLLDSAAKMQRSIPQEYQDEMHGIADGSGMTYEQILVLNTFVDTTLAVRAVALALQLSGAPHLESVEFLGAATDDADNNGDGTTDEPGEGLLNPYVSLPTASAVELPENVKVRFVLVDPAGVDPSTLRIALDTSVYLAGNPALEVVALAENNTRLQVTFTPPSALEPGSTSCISIFAGNQSIVTNPPPAHAHFMREERLTFTIRGAGKLPHQVPNRGVDDGRTRPPSVAFAVTGSATPDGMPRLAQHFTLLDGNTSHNHTAVFVHHPETGAPFAVVGWAGVAWGISGLSANGLGVACQPSDTLDNSVVGSLLAGAGDLATAKLAASGIPIGFAMRQVLEQSATTSAAVDKLGTLGFAYGWNCLLADASGATAAVEIDSNEDNHGSGGVYAYGSDPSVAGNLDADGKPWASLGPDDLRLTSHYKKNRADMYSLTVQGQRVVPQPQWSSMYFRSLRADALLGDALAGSLGKLDAAGAIAVLRHPELVDTSDSMNAVVIEPATRTLHSAMGVVPATDAPFEILDLRQETP